MKPKLHPKYYSNTKVICACGNTFTTSSTLKEIQVEICNVCHPFYTGEMKLIDTQGRIEKFQSKQKKAKKLAHLSKKKATIKKAKERPSSLKEMLQKSPETEKTQKKN